MEDKLAETEAIRVWFSWLFLWVVWVISTTLGWVLASLLTLGIAIAFAIPDPDAAEAYLSSPLGERLFDGFMLGAMLGLIPAILIASLWVVLRRSARDVVGAVLVTIVGSGLLCVVGSGGGPQVESNFMTMLRLGILGGVTGGGFVGLCQWLILRRRVRRANGWIGLTVAGWVIGWTITLWGIGFPEQLSSAWPIGWAAGAVEQSAPNLILSAAALVMGGAVVGLGQWLLLRQDVRRAGWWILATAIGWVIAAGAGVGVITGTTLVLLLHDASRSPRQKAV
jgi:hypothetical protein